MTESLRSGLRDFREQEIVRTARAALARVGCRAFTMDEVAGELGISKATLYSHFASRGDLIRRALSEPHGAAVAEVGRRIEEDARGEGLRGAADDLVRGCLGLGETGDGPTLLCCLCEIECPYADWDELDRLFDRLSAAGRPRGPRLGLARALRLLSAHAADRARVEGRSPVARDAEFVVRLLLPSR